MNKLSENVASVPVTGNSWNIEAFAHKLSKIKGNNLRHSIDVVNT